MVPADWRLCSVETCATWHTFCVASDPSPLEYGGELDHEGDDSRDKCDEREQREPRDDAKALPVIIRDGDGCPDRGREDQPRAKLVKDEARKRTDEHTSEHQSQMGRPYDVFC